MILLSKHNILELNKATIQAHGGNFTPPNNLLKESNLDYLIDAIDAEMFGQPLYPEIYDKAALYLFNIATGHIFIDGNKRTGLAAATIFLQANRHDISIQFEEEIEIDFSERAKYEEIKNLNRDEVIYDFVIKVASGESSLEECQEWFKNNIVPL